MIRTILLAASALIVTSCHHVYYAPSTANISQLTEKDEVRVNVGAVSGFDSEFGGGDLQFAYAPAKNFGVMVNGFSVGRKEETTDTRQESGKGTYGELGLGYWTTFDKQKEWTFEVMAGAGSGVVNSDYDKGENSKVSVTKFFLQPAIGYKWDYIEVAFAPRISHVQWNVKQLNTTESSVDSDMQFIRSKPDFLAFEPSLILRAGAKNMKLQVALTTSSPGNYMGYEPPIESVVGYIGVSVNFSAKKPASPMPAALTN